MKYLFVKNNITNGWLCFPLFHDVIHDEKLSFFSAGGESPGEENGRKVSVRSLPQSLSKAKQLLYSQYGAAYVAVHVSSSYRKHTKL